MTQAAFTYPELTIETLEQVHWRRPGIFIVNFELMSHFVLVFLLLTLSRQMPTGERRISCRHADEGCLTMVNGLKPLTLS